MNKIVSTPLEAVQDVFDDATIMVSGFGEAGAPDNLMHALVEKKVGGLTVISNNCGYDDHGLARLIHRGQVRRMIVSFPNYKGAWAFYERYRRGEIELEIVPQGTLAERIRAGGAGIGGFYTPTGVGTELAANKEMIELDGTEYLLERPLKADFAFLRAKKADRWGNLTFNKSGRNFGPVMATAAETTIVEVDEVVELGALDPEVVVTPGIFVHKVVQMSRYQPNTSGKK